MATYVVKSQGKEYTAEVVDNASGGATVTIEGESFHVEFVGGDGNAVSAIAAPTAAVPVPTARLASASAPSAIELPPVAVPKATGAGIGSIAAPIPGKVIAVHVAVGATVETGDTVITLEAMKMENAIAAPISGTVKEIPASEGAEVTSGQLLMVIE